VAPVQQQSCFLFFCAPAVAVRSDATGNPLSPLVDAAAFAAGVPVHLAHAVIRQESNYNPSLRGAAGEYGIGQIKCQTARSVGFAGDCLQLFDASTNLTYSMRYLRLALDRGGAGCAGVSLYQRGVYGRPSCSGYGRQVMARAGMSP
jgi:soluble lytic murein transglycosylase-like protein